MTNRMTASLPDGFVYLRDHVPDLIESMDYAGPDNFLGRKVTGYQRGVAVLTRAAAQALTVASRQAARSGLRFKVFDAYRPQRAVDEFLRWINEPDDADCKALFYPHIDKSQLFTAGYLAARSAHSRGSTLDLSLVDASGNALDMGTRFDFFGPESWPQSDAVSTAQRANRDLLAALMTAAGFHEPHPQELWHFTLRDEPYIDTWFDFPVD